MAVFYGPQLKMHVEFIENELAKSTWFAGNELTGAGMFLARDGSLICRYHDEFPSTNFSHQSKYWGNGCFSYEGLLEKNGRATSV